MIEKEYRIVAYWVEQSDDWASMEPTPAFGQIKAQRDTDPPPGFVLEHELRSVGPIRGQPDKRMVYLDRPYISNTLKGLEELSQNLSYALIMPVLYRDDFGEID